MGNKNLIGVQEAARIVRVSTRTIKRLALNGDLPHVHKLDGITGAYLFDRADVEAYAATRVAA